MNPSVRPSLSSSPTAAVEQSSSENTAARGETGVIPLTLVDLIGTIVAALIPALIGSIFIATRLHALRKRRLSEWAGQDFLIQEGEQLDWQGEMEVVDFPAEELQEEHHSEAEGNDSPSLLVPASVASGVTSSSLSRMKCRLRGLEEPSTVANGVASSRLSRIKCRLRGLEEPLSPLEHAYGQES